MTTAEAKTIINNLLTSVNALITLKQSEVDPFTALSLQEAQDSLNDTVSFWKTQ